LWLTLFVTSLFSPPVLDDADGTHANAARQMLLSGDWVTLRVNNVRYLEKAPLPYWLAAISFRLFGFNTFAAHLPGALSVLLLTLLGFRWAAQAYGDRAALYTGFGVLTSAGVFLFTRVFIPDVLLSLLLAIVLYCFVRSISAADATRKHSANSRSLGSPSSVPSSLYPYTMWAALALAVLTKGLVAIVFLFGTVILFLAFTRHFRRWRCLKPFSGLALLLLIAAPWHILAGLRNTGGINGHGFFWFYFINEHVLRFLGQRIPRDYNKLPGYLYWGLHVVWLFPWSLFAPLAAIAGWKRWISRKQLRGRHEDDSVLSFGGASTPALVIFSALVLVFFSLSTNQEYYTFPAYLPLLLLVAASLARAEEIYLSGLEEERYARCWVAFAHAALTAFGLLIAAALGYGLWISRHLATVPDVGALLAHRGVGSYTLSMSSLFDLTGPSFAALRLPAALAFAAFAVGPGIAWVLRVQRRHLAATTAIALTSSVFLFAAHIALVRFTPMLSSWNMAVKIQQLEAAGAISPDNTLLLYGDQAYGSSIPFYLNLPLNRPALLVDGRSSSMLFGSSFADAQPLFLTPAELLAQWGRGRRKLLFVPIERRDDADRLLGSRAILLDETAGKALLTDRPLDR
ncbi:MAG TPA: glycosyltransferase family 39 protein, partial [Acidobacteriaceae bacterium]|nr:glycosyltransferase family 39 protein [Acidobacteriaceae bacterium]